ncbi:MAG: DEAD/DEAH box helicase [Rikenellaceae bacterium]
MTFNDLNLIEPIKTALQDEGYINPTPIQAEAIPILLEGRDLLGCAQTGTGKTAAFSIPIIQHIYNQKQKNRFYNGIRALVLTPTRELATQIGESFKSYGRYTGIKHTVIFGGVGQTPQTDAIRAGVDVLVATPGRLLDLVNQGFIKLDKLEFFVLDEADHMLDMGFIHDIKRVLTIIPKKRQSLFFSATMPREIEYLANTILSNPAKVEVTPASSTVDKIEQYLYYVEEKAPLLIELLKNPVMESVLVFTRTKHGADKVAKLLNKASITAEAIHGNKSQNARQNALNNFKLRTTRVLIATDIAARGIDVDNLSHVINYELPNVPETYVHRIGRTGRAGREGVAYSFCNVEEVPLLKDIEKLIGKRITVSGGNAYANAEVKAAVAQKRAEIKEETKRRNMFGSKRDGSYWRNKKRAEEEAKGTKKSADSKPKEKKEEVKTYKSRTGGNSNKRSFNSFSNSRNSSSRHSGGRGKGRR